jgi:hypothetical protein
MPELLLSSGYLYMSKPVDTLLSLLVPGNKQYTFVDVLRIASEANAPSLSPENVKKILKSVLIETQDPEIVSAVSLRNENKGSVSDSQLKLLRAEEFPTANIEKATGVLGHSDIGLTLKEFLLVYSPSGKLHTRVMAAIAEQTPAGQVFIELIATKPYADNPKDVSKAIRELPKIAANELAPLSNL